jgi:hypothetical protein
MKTLEMLEVFGHWFWEFATTEQVQEVRDHEQQAQELQDLLNEQQEIYSCAALDNGV